VPRPFPGMDPYLESPSLWRTLHTHLVVEICKDLQPQLVPAYVASAEERVVLGPRNTDIYPDVAVREHESRPGGGAAVAVRPSVKAAAGIAVPEEVVVPDLTRRERFVTIRDTQSNAIVTVIEILSPWNKTGEGHEQYTARHAELLLSEANLVEIDLLRRGRHTIAAPASLLGPSDYRICMHRAGANRFGVLRLSVRDPLPNIGIPLRFEDPDVVLHLGDVFARCYEGGGYAYKAGYRTDPDPPLREEDARWAQELPRKQAG